MSNWSMCMLLCAVLVCGLAAAVTPQGNAAENLPDLTEEEEAVFPNMELLQASWTARRSQRPQ